MFYNYTPPPPKKKWKDTDKQKGTETVTLQFTPLYKKSVSFLPHCPIFFLDKYSKTEAIFKTAKKKSERMLKY